MFDKYSSLERLKVFEFKFNSSKYKIWKDGQVFKEAEKEIGFHFLPELNSNDKIKVTCNPAIPEINQENSFDIFITASDRLSYYVIPKNSNANHPAIEMFKSIFGSTRETMLFNEKTPFCCNLFTIAGNINVISFSFSNPVILIEFHL